MATASFLLRIAFAYCAVTSVSILFGQDTTVRYPCYSSGTEIDGLPYRGKRCFLFPAGHDGYRALVACSAPILGFPLSNPDRGAFSVDIRIEWEKFNEVLDHFTLFAMSNESQQVAMVYFDNATLRHDVALFTGESVVVFQPDEFEADAQVDLIGFVRVDEQPISVLRISKSQKYGGYWFGYIKDSDFKLTRISFKETMIKSVYAAHEYVIVRYYEGDPSKTFVHLYQIAKSSNGVESTLVKTIDTTNFAPSGMSVRDITTDSQGRRLGIVGVETIEGRDSGVLRVLSDDGEEGASRPFEYRFADDITPSSMCFSEDTDHAAVFLSRDEWYQLGGKGRLTIFDEIEVIHHKDQTKTNCYSRQRVHRSDVFGPEIVWPKGFSQPFAGWGVFVPRNSKK